MVTNLSPLVPNVLRLFALASGRDKRELITILLTGTGEETVDKKIFTIVSKFIKVSERFT